MPQSLPDDWISAYLDGELTADQKRRAEQLLATDQRHAQLLEELRQLRTDLQSMPRYKLESDLTERVLDSANLKSQSVDDLTDEILENSTSIKTGSRLEQKVEAKSNQQNWVKAQAQLNFAAASILALAALLLISVAYLPGLSSRTDNMAQANRGDFEERKSLMNSESEGINESDPPGSLLGRVDSATASDNFDESGSAPFAAGSGKVNGSGNKQGNSNDERAGDPDLKGADSADVDKVLPKGGRNGFNARGSQPGTEYYEYSKDRNEKTDGSDGVMKIESDKKSGSKNENSLRAFGAKSDDLKQKPGAQDRSLAEGKTAETEKQLRQAGASNQSINPSSGRNQDDNQLQQRLGSEANAQNDMLDLSEEGERLDEKSKSGNRAATSRGGSAQTRSSRSNKPVQNNVDKDSPPTENLHDQSRGRSKPKVDEQSNASDAQSKVMSKEKDVEEDDRGLALSGNTGEKDGADVGQRFRKGPINDLTANWHLHDKKNPGENKPDSMESIKNDPAQLSLMYSVPEAKFAMVNIYEDEISSEKIRAVFAKYKIDFDIKQTDESIQAQQQYKNGGISLPAAIVVEAPEEQVLTALKSIAADGQVPTIDLFGASAEFYRRTNDASDPKQSSATPKEAGGDGDAKNRRVGSNAIENNVSRGIAVPVPVVEQIKEQLKSVGQRFETVDENADSGGGGLGAGGGMGGGGNASDGAKSMALKDQINKSNSQRDASKKSQSEDNKSEIDSNKQGIKDNTNGKGIKTVEIPGKGNRNMPPPGNSERALESKNTDRKQVENGKVGRWQARFGFEKSGDDESRQKEVLPELEKQQQLGNKLPEIGRRQGNSEKPKSKQVVRYYLLINRVPRPLADNSKSESLPVPPESSNDK